LQEQIFFKDIPALRDALGIPFTATYMKGRANYLCLHRLDQLNERTTPIGADVFLPIIGEWSRRTETGDRAELDDLPEDLPFWSEVSATAETCLGTECPRNDDCFVTRMRKRAAAADVYIVNHHLLCADLAVRQNAFGEVIPACSNAIVDEAHQLEDIATQYFGFSASTYRVEELARDLERLVAPRLVDRKSGGGRGRGPPRVNTDVDDRQSRDDIAKAIEKLRDELRFLLRAGDPDYVYFVEFRARGIFLRASPIDVSKIVRELLFDRMRTTVLTSATLTVDGRFDYIRDRLGIAGADQVRLKSEFDFAQQALLYLPLRMPDPRSPEFAMAAGREVIEILKRSRGRAFVLFTSYATLRDVQAIAEM